jgi:hypothetical protein
MNKVLDIPVFSNDDDTHCVQATIQMILKYFFPERDYPSWYLDQVTYHHKEGNTWDLGVFSFLTNLGLSLVVIDEFSFSDFSQRGISYLKSIWTKPEFRRQKSNANLDFEYLLARDFMTKNKEIVFQQRAGTSDDIRNLFKKGYLVIPNLNAFALDNEDGICGHYVVVTGIEKDNVIFNDSGPPPVKNRKASWKVFEYSRRENPSLFAIKR